MNIEISNETLNKMKEEGYDDYKYAVLKTVAKSCQGPMLALSPANEIDESKYDTKEQDGYTFAVNKEVT